MFREFLIALHGDIPMDFGVEVRRIPGLYYVRRAEDHTIPSDLDVSVWHHGVFPRRLAGGQIENAGLVFIDTDGSLDDPEVWPMPTAAVHSGRPNGFHLYWKLSRYIEPVEATHLALLATTAFDGDPQVCHPRVTTRVPGSANTKHMPPIIVKTIFLRPEKTYDPEYLAEMLVAAALAPHYISGERHKLSLALGAVLARAGWPLDRAIRCVNHLYDLSPGSDRADKIACIRSTYTRIELGEAVSAVAIKDVLGKDPFTQLLKGLGVAARDGDILVDGEVIGKVINVERDVVRHVLEVNDLRSGSGRLLAWANTHWRLLEEPELASKVFGVLANAKYIRQGDVLEFPATAKTAKNVASMAVGTLIATPLDEALPHHLPLSNGTLDLRTLTIEPTTKEHNHRWVVNIAFDPEARCPAWRKFIAEVIPEQDVRMHIQEWMGYALMSGNRWQRMLWLHGPSGTGKSTFLKALGLLLGPAAVAVSSEKFDDYTVAQLANVRAGLCAELSPRLLRTSTVKSLVAGDPVNARHPYGRPFSVKYTGKLIWGSNALPPLDQGEGMWRRIVPIGMFVTPAWIDHGLEETLKEEASGILNWAIEGLRRLLRDQMPNGGWPLPASVQATIDEYKAATDLIGRFADEEVELIDGAHIPMLEVYQRYVSWASERNVKIGPLGPGFVQDCRRIKLEVDPTFNNGTRSVYLKGGKLRPGQFSGAGMTVSQN